MIAYLKGLLSSKTPLLLNIECAGVGYEVNIPLSTYDKLPRTGEEVNLFIHYSFNDTDGVRLFGFLTLAEKELFRDLISVAKIGPRIALSILSGLSVKDFIQAIKTANASLIATIPGIGKKSAERLIIELKDKVEKIGIDLKPTIKSDKMAVLVAETETALLTLGYRIQDIRRAFTELLKDEKNYESAEDLIKNSIRFLYSIKNL
ncbi:MAG: Holliday junction branch migration protein RuvA [Candidatus Cloacimonetes bacterium]|nr:Holliday junction branch migration protein RuvA [Candidatus Cloacimonadota bacterium]